MTRHLAFLRLSGLRPQSPAPRGDDLGPTLHVRILAPGRAALCHEGPYVYGAGPVDPPQILKRQKPDILDLINLPCLEECFTLL
mmetsp:Transcript_101624/g.296272  ORF Transcript_101624/g.296272 Transcript_101624/m.296272 type:complete len:84 (+) Transcript_101624:485-736(+)